uniref:PITH domain-containing protein n=1 Tax=Oncorhynchus tshawytscha TaxID=74940 RepID=A0AAZ3P003_ONCTS
MVGTATAAVKTSMSQRNGAWSMHCISALTLRNCSVSTKQEKAMGNSCLNHGINGLTGRRFTGSVKLKGIIIAGEDDESHPAEMRLYKNIPQMSFDDTGREPEQAFRLNRDPLAQLEYPTKIARFSNVNHLSIHISRNFGTESTRVYYIGLRGEYSQAHRHEVTICNYEASANPADHKVDSIIPQTNFIS